MVTLSNCRPQQFYGHFTVLWPWYASNCRPWQFHGRFREMTKTLKKLCHSNCQPRQFDGHFEIQQLKLQTSAVLWPLYSHVELDVLKLQTLAVSWPVFSHDLKCPYNCQPRQFWWHCPQTADLGSFMASLQFLWIILFVLLFTVQMISSSHTVSPYSPAIPLFPCPVLLELFFLGLHLPKTGDHMCPLVPPTQDPSGGRYKNRKF